MSVEVLLAIDCTIWTAVSLGRSLGIKHIGTVGVDTFSGVNVT